MRVYVGRVFVWRFRTLATASKRSRIKWWLPSGTQVLAAMESGTNEYVKIFPDPSITQCWGPSWQSWAQWPQPSGYIKRHNLTTLEAWAMGERSESVTPSIMDIDRGVWSSSTST